MACTAVGVGPLWVSVNPIRFAVRRPASVRNSDMRHKLQRKVQRLFQIWQANTQTNVSQQQTLRSLHEQVNSQLIQPEQ